MDKSTYFLLRKHLDSVIFLESFVKIDTPEGLTPWNMEPYQKHLVRDFSKNRAINKSKKTGISTVLAGEALHHAYTIPGIQKAFVSTGQRIAGELLGKFYDEYDSIPSALQVPLTTRSAEKVEFPNKVRIFSLPSGDPDKIRGLGLRGRATDVIMDEYAFAPNDKQLWLVVRDFQRFGGKVTLNSTPKGKRGKYYEICAPLQPVHRGLAAYRSTEWSYHEIPYTRCKRLLVQEKSLKEDIDEVEFQEEYCCEFIDESMSFFPFEMIWAAQKVESYVEDGGDKPIYFGIDFGKSVGETVVMVVEEWEPEKFRILWIEPMKGIDYTVQMEMIKQLSASYNPITINIDASGPGGQTILDFLQKDDALASKVWGFNFDPSFKEKIIIRTRMLMSRGRLLLPTKSLPWSEVLESQLHQVQRTTTESGERTRYSGKEGSKQDDYAWALALAVWKEFQTDSAGTFFEQVKDEALLRIEKGSSPIIWEV